MGDVVIGDALRLCGASSPHFRVSPFTVIISSLCEHVLFSLSLYIFVIRY